MVPSPASYLILIMTMAGKDVVISVNILKKQQEVAAAECRDCIKTLADLKSKFHHLPSSSSSSSSSSQPRCPRVPEGLRSDVKNYEPKLVSFGPYHHGELPLANGEMLKLKLAEAYIQKLVSPRGDSVEEPLDRIYNKISGRIGELKRFYYEDFVKKYTDEEFTVMMLVDGCALLWFILCVCLHFDHEHYNIRHQDLSLLHRDALLLENQLPYQLLEGLMEMAAFPIDAWQVIFQEFFGMIEEEEYSFLRKIRKNCCSLQFLAIVQSSNREHETNTVEESNRCPHHLLGLYRQHFLGDEPSSPTHSQAKNDKKAGSVGDVKEQVMASFRNVKELMAAGIRIKRSPTRYLRDISFTSNGITACLRLPPITIDDSTKAMFINLIAYEMSSDVPHDFISYLRFLDSLIDHAEDVKELQAAGILQNNLGTHEEVAKFFDTVSANLESNFLAYKDVRVKIRKHLRSHYNSKLKTWITECLDNYFSSPWTIIAWIGAALVLFFTAVQTYLSVFPH